MVLDELSLSEAYLIVLHVYDFSEMTASWWRNEKLDVKATVQKKKLIHLVIELSATSQSWVCSIMKCAQMLPMVLESVPDWFLWALFDSHIAGDVFMKMNGAQMSRLDRLGSEWLLLLLFSMCNPGRKKSVMLVDKKTAEHA